MQPPQAIEPHAILHRTTSDLVQHLVLPLTSEPRCRLLDLVPTHMRGQPHHYVCHAWGCSARELLQVGGWVGEVEGGGGGRRRVGGPGLNSSWGMGRRVWGLGAEAVFQYPFQGVEAAAAAKAIHVSR